jgi:hypothetical protein
MKLKKKEEKTLIMSLYLFGHECNAGKYLDDANDSDDDSCGSSENENDSDDKSYSEDSSQGSRETDDEETRDLQNQRKEALFLGKTALLLSKLLKKMSDSHQCWTVEPARIHLWDNN